MTNFIMAVLTGLDVLIAFCMIVLILMQQSKGGGGLGAIGGDATGSVFGAGSGNVMTKTTTILAACFLGITLALAVMAGRRSEGDSVLESSDYDVEQRQEGVEPVEESAVGAEESEEAGEADDASDDASETDDASMRSGEAVEGSDAAERDGTTE